MTKTFEERNQTDSARRKLKSLAKVSGIEFDLVSALASFTWDYDTDIGKEPLGWVDNDVLPSTAEKQLHFIADVLKLPPDFTLESDQASEELIQACTGISPGLLWTNFNAAVVNKNYAQVSEFASYNYLRGINKSRIKSLGWTDKKVDLIQIARNLFLKLFRGGSVDRYRIDYLWCDLVLPLEYAVNKSKFNPWIEPLLTSIESLPPNSGLKDLLACCKGLIGGDKYFKQTVLESLSYADVLQVTDLPVSDMFIAKHRDELASHFYSNEWSFPLRFWSTNGGTVNREVIPEL